MADITNLESVRHSRAGVKPLPGRSGRKARAEETVQTLSVEKLKNGETADFGAVLNEGEQPASIRQRYLGGRPVLTAKASQNKKADMPVAEQIEQLQKIRQSSIEYESIFVNQLVKQMRQSPLAETPGGETFSEIAEQPFRDFLSQAGGLGLADSIVQQVAHQEGLEQTLQENPGIMGANWRPSIAPNMLKQWTGTLGPGPDRQGPEAAGDPGETAGTQAGQPERMDAGPEKKIRPGPGPNPPQRPDE